VPSRLWITVSILSLLLSLFITLLWIRSHYTADLLVYSSGRGDYHEYVSIPGQFRYTRVQGWTRRQPLQWHSGEFRSTQVVFGQQAVYRRWTVLGIGFDGGARRVPVSEQSVSPSVVISYQIMAVPFAQPAAVLGAIGLFPWLRLRRRRMVREERRRQGLCPVCGYDLRASGGRCPECGKEK
jgi:hypothetical protein